MIRRLIILLLIVGCEEPVNTITSSVPNKYKVVGKWMDDTSFERGIFYTNTFELDKNEDCQWGQDDCFPLHTEIMWFHWIRDTELENYNCINEPSLADCKCLNSGENIFDIDSECVKSTKWAVCPSGSVQHDRFILKWDFDPNLNEGQGGFPSDPENSCENGGSGVVYSIGYVMFGLKFIQGIKSWGWFFNGDAYASSSYANLVCENNYNGVCIID